jgi:hypothetical protein
MYNNRTQKFFLATNSCGKIKSSLVLKKWYEDIILDK